MARSPIADILSADRSLHREQTDRLADELTWLHDPDTIPPEAILGNSAESVDVGAQCYNLAVYVDEKSKITYHLCRLFMLMI